MRPLLAALAAITYVPLLLTAPGQISADTKAYLYLDPGGLLARATSMWDPNIALGYVPHQNIGYLWPMGPWFWLFDSLGSPDWVAQRLWWGSLLFAAGAGTAVLLRRFAWRPEAIWAASFTYAMTPYVLTLMARISGILIAYAALPWLILLALAAARSGGWRHPALFALVAATAGSVNLTALILVGVGPLLWMAHVVWVTREVTLRRALGASLRIGALTLLTSAWWLAGLAVQAGYGNDVLRYSETAEAVASTSTANEVLRGLGYWFFYGEDRLGPWIEPSIQYTQEAWLLAVTYLIPVLCLVGAAVGRWRHRTFFVGLVAAGLLLAIGTYPWDDPPLLGRAIKAVLLSDRGLAMRSLPRAAPLLVLGLAALLGAGIGAVVARRARAGRVLAGGAVVLAVLGQVPLWSGGTVPENLRRPEEVPSYWREAAAWADRGDHDTRLLELPGGDFASYRWGNTVDPITPGLLDRDVAYRELIPFGPPQSSALLDALDLPLQEHVLDPEALAPIARLLRAADLLVRSDLAFERFNTPRPKNLWDLVRSAPGLGEPQGFGPGAPNRPSPEASLDDELWLLTDADLPDPPEVAVVPVEDPVDIVSAHGTERPLIVAGDAYSLVDAAAAGLIDGSELIRFAADLTASEIDRALDEGAVLLVTDGNRRRGQRWQTVRHTKGYTEPAGLDALVEDHSDNRLPILDDAGDDGRTVAVHRGGISASATSYGNRITFEPADRPARAVDGDPRTAWRTAGFDHPAGERLVLQLDEPTTTDRVRLLQPVTGPITRWLTEIRLRFDGGEPVEVKLDPSSRSEPGQLVTFDRRTFERLEIELVDDDTSDPPRYTGQSSLGFAEVRIGDSDELVLDEWIRTPVHLLDAARAASADRPLAVVLSRLRQDPTDPTRSDEERRMSRLIELPTPRQMSLSGSARISARAPDAVLDAVLGRGGEVQVSSTGRLNGSRAQVGAAALDGDRETEWLSPRTAPTGFGIVATAPAPVTVERLDLVVLADGRHSVPNQLAVSVDGGEAVTVDLPAVADSSEPGHLTDVSVRLPEPLVGRSVMVEVTAARPVEVVDWHSRRPVAQPVGIAELGIPGLSVPTLPETFDSGCRDDLLAVDGEPVAVRITGATDDALAGRALSLATCDGAPLDLESGEHRIRTARGVDVGLDLDQLVLRSAAGGDPQPPGDTLLAAAGGAPPAPDVVVHHRSADRYEVELRGTPGEDAWLVLGQSFNEGWSASARDGGGLGPPQLVDGFANGWRVPLGGDGVAIVDLRFEPQRGVRYAIGASVLGVLLCLVLAWRGRPAPPEAPARPDPIGRERIARYAGDAPRLRVALIVAAGVAVAGALVVPPLLALLLGAAAFVGCRCASARGWLVAASPLLALAAGTYVVVQQIRHDIPPGVEWAADLDRAHLVALLAVLVLAVEAVVDRAWQRPGHRSDARR